MTNDLRKRETNYVPKYQSVETYIKIRLHIIYPNKTPLKYTRLSSPGYHNDLTLSSSILSPLCYLTPVHYTYCIFCRWFVWV